MEDYWGDVHHSLIQYFRDAVQPGLPSGFVARVEERVYVEGCALPKQYVPDVSVIERGSSDGAGAAVAVAEPELATDEDYYLIRLPDAETREGFIEIRDVGKDHQVVTVIEVLSPANKLEGGRGRQEYLSKRSDCIAAGLTFVEIDLLRRGAWTVAATRSSFSAGKRIDYVVCVKAGWRNELGVHTRSIRRRLPSVGVPIAPEHPYVVVDLQGILDDVYDRGAYDRDIDYSEPLDPPLHPEDAEWVKSAIRPGKPR